MSYEHHKDNSSRRSSKASESETESECSRGRRRSKHRKCSHKRRTSSCSEMFICHRVDEPCEINRSKSTTELHSRRKHSSSSKSHRHSTSSDSNESASQDSDSNDDDDECCYHTKRKHRCYKKVRSKSKERSGDGGSKRDSNNKKGSESSECKENDKDQMRVKKDKKKVEIASSGGRKTQENNKGSGGGKGKASSATSATSSTKGGGAVNKKRPPSAKNIQKKGSQDEKMNRSIDKPKTPSDEQQQQNDYPTKTTTITTNEEMSEDDKNGMKEIVTKAEIHTTETLQTTDNDEGVLTDATYTIEKREISEIPTIREELTPVNESSKKVSFKGDDEGDEVQKEIQQPVESSTSDEKLRAISPLPPSSFENDDLPENIPRPKSQTPESIGSFTVLEDGDDADQKLKEFDEMTHDDSFRLQPMITTTTTGDEDESEEQQYFDDSSSMEKLPRRSKLRDDDGFAIIEDTKDQDSGIEPSPRAQPRTKIPAPRFSNSSAVPISRRSFIIADDRPRSTRIEGRKPGDKNACNMTTVTQSIQKNIRR